MVSLTLFSILLHSERVISIWGIDKCAAWDYYSHKILQDNSVAPKYEIGQKVIITPVKNQHSSPRDADIEVYAGTSGKVTDYYWISKCRGEVLYIYTVRMEADQRDIVLHEDEIQACIE